MTLKDKIMKTEHPLKGFFKTHEPREAQNAHTITTKMSIMD